MPYKLIALDLDDTLLDYNKEISQENADAIKKAQDAGINVIIATGRNYDSIKPFNQKLNINSYSIACGGAQVFDADGNLVYFRGVPSEIAKKVMQYAAVNKIHFQLYLEDGLYYLQENDYSRFYENHCKIKGKADKSLLSRKSINTAKILFLDTDENTEKHRKELTEMFPSLSIKTSQSYMLEISSPEATKGNALSVVAEKMGISMKETVAMGDSEIDASMLLYAGLGVAMANSVKMAFDAADVTTDSCDKNGVANAINKYILHEEV